MGNHFFTALRARMPEGGRRFIETPDGTVLTYDDLLAGTARYALALQTLGAVPGDRIAIQVEKSADAVFLMLACIRAGFVILPLNTAYTVHELDYFVGDAEPAILVCDPSREGGLQSIAARYGVKSVVNMDPTGAGTLRQMAAGQATDFEDVARGGDDLAAILYTSGTTGRSKGAMLSHDNLLSNALTLADYWRFTGEDVLLHALPIYHTHGLFVAINTVLMAGASMLFMPKFVPDDVMRLMLRATVMMGVPTFYTRLLGHPDLGPMTTAGIRLFISGSAPLLAETHHEWVGRTGHAILERYGMTETNMNTSNPYDGERIAGTVGLPLPGVSVRVVDAETGALLPKDTIGMIEVKGPNVFSGYWWMPEKTAAEFKADGFFITGDLGTIDGRGYVRILGRGKDLIISGGFNVYPKEVEEVIDTIDGVVESAVIGLPHRDFGEGVTAVIVPVTGKCPDVAAIMALIETRLAKFKQPKRIVFVDELPRNAMGKVQKNVLRDRFKDFYIG